MQWRPGRLKCLAARRTEWLRLRLLPTNLLVPTIGRSAQLQVRSREAWIPRLQRTGWVLSISHCLIGASREAPGLFRWSGDAASERLSVRLIDPADGCHIWSAKFERTVTDAFAVQDELTGLIVAGVRDTLWSPRA
jgi:hypothetical protein